MKVAMVTPMAPESAIADVMMQAVPHLEAEWDVEVWAPAEETYRHCPVPFHQFSANEPDVARELREYDLVIYVLGNSPWHSSILPLTHLVPGLVVLHDVALTDMVRHAAIQQSALDRLVAQIAEDSGETLASAFETANPPGGPTEWVQIAASLPLADYALEGSLGVVVHSQWHAGLVDGMTFGETTVAPLPVPSPKVGFDTNQRGSVHQTLERLPSDAVLLVTVGAVNANRRIDLLLQAIAGDPALQQVRLWAVGPAEARVAGELRAHADSLGLGDRFTVTGRVNDELLQSILARADMAAALRDPVLEGQSASVLTQMLAGTPLIVLDHAHYSELPDEAVLKVDLADPVASLRACITHLALDASARSTRGEKGRDHVLATRSGAAYAEAIRLAGESAIQAIPFAHAVAHLGSALQRLDLSVGAVADAATRLGLELFTGDGVA